MPLRYHLVYYAVFVLLLSVAYLVHPLFYIFLLAYLIYLVKRFGRKMLFLLFLLPIILRPVTSSEVPSIVSGRVKDIRDKCETKINQNVQKKTNLKTSLNNLEKIE